MRRIEPRAGDERTRSFFAWLPITLGGDRSWEGETRWWERVTVRERYVYSPPNWGGGGYSGWEPVAFVDEAG